MHKQGRALRPPTPGGVPRRTILQGALGVFGALTVPGIGGCGSDPRDPRTSGPHVVALKADTPAILSGDEASVFQVRRSVALPLKDRPDSLPATPPYPRGVWYTPEKLRVQLDYVITNLESRELGGGESTLEVLVDGWNEFIWYSPQVRLVDDAVLPDRSCVQRATQIPPKGRVEGRVSFDDFERMAIALAGIFNKAENPGHLLDPTTNLETSPLATKYIPGTISGITGFNLGLRITGDASARVALEAIVEVIDLEGVLMEEGEEATSRNRRAGDMGRRELIPVITTEEG